MNASTFFLKPAVDVPAATPLFEQYIPELQATLAFRSLDLQADTSLIHQWVNQAYAQKFWQLSGSQQMIGNIYAGILANVHAHSFIGLIDGKPVSLIDSYQVAKDELALHIDNVTEGDGGLHLLMCPPRELQKGWTWYLLRCFQQFFFSHDKASRLFAEPDQANTLANKLAIDAGFHFDGTIQLSYKTANLYSLTREQFSRR